MKTLTQEQKNKLRQPLPAEAKKQHPTKAYLTVINPIYVTERLNDTFEPGVWQISSEVVDNKGKMIVVKTTLSIPEYGIRYECYGGNDNADLGDAYKGAVTDAITKIGSWLGIGVEVWKNIPEVVLAQPMHTKSKLTEAMLDKSLAFCDAICEWLMTASVSNGGVIDVEAVLRDNYDISDTTIQRVNAIFNNYKMQKL